MKIDKITSKYTEISGKQKLSDGTVITWKTKVKHRRVHYAESYDMNVQCLCGKTGNHDMIEFSSRIKDITCPYCIELLNGG